MTYKNNDSQRNIWLLPIFFVLCYGVAAFASQFTPGDWYEQLNRAPWDPPDITFPIVWSILYALIAIAGWLVFSSQSGFARMLWIFQLVLNAAWSWFFFEQHWVSVALADIALLAVLISALIAHCWKSNLRLVSWLMVPYLVWILLATSLNAYIYLNN